MYKRYQDIVGGCHPNHLFSVGIFSKKDMKYSIKNIKYRENMSELAYKVNIFVLSLQHVRLGIFPYIFIACQPQTNNKSIFKLMSFTHVMLHINP